MANHCLVVKLSGRVERVKLEDELVGQVYGHHLLALCWKPCKQGVAGFALSMVAHFT